MLNSSLSPHARSLFMSASVGAEYSSWSLRAWFLDELALPSPRLPARLLLPLAERTCFFSLLLLLPLLPLLPLRLEDAVEFSRFGFDDDDAGRLSASAGC